MVFTLLAGIGTGAYFVLSEWLTMQKADGLIAAKDYGQAVTVLKAFSEKTYLYPRQSPYLMAIAMVKEYATAKPRTGRAKTP